MATGKPDTARTVPCRQAEMLPAGTRAGRGAEVPQPSAAPHPTSSSLRRLTVMEAETMPAALDSHFKSVARHGARDERQGLGAGRMRVCVQGLGIGRGYGARTPRPPQ